MKNIEKNYQSLLQMIVSEIESGQTRIERFVDFQKVITNWNIGKMIFTSLLDDNHQAPRGEYLFERLEKDTNINHRILRQTVQFYKTYPNLKRTPGLTWTHYTLLMTIPQQKLRKKWEQRIIKERINSREFRELIRPALSVIPERRSLKAQRGRLYHYRVVKVNYLHSQNGNLMIDCGFSIHIEKPMDQIINILSPSLVKVVKKKTGYEVHQTKDKNRDILYTYKALIERVIDGDTILVNIDCGFGIWTRQRLRLNSIDTPEKITDAGIKAKIYVESKLKEVNFVVIKTYGSDKYDRYLVDVFYLPNEPDSLKVAESGRFLNEEIVTKGFGEYWK